MSAGTITQLIASDSSQYSSQPFTVYSSPDNTVTNTKVHPTYVCLNDMCLLNNTALFGSMPTFASLEECQNVCGVKPSTLRPQ